MEDPTPAFQIRIFTAAGILAMVKLLQRLPKTIGSTKNYRQYQKLQEVPKTIGSTKNYRQYQKHETWKTTWGLSAETLDIIKGPSNKQICEKLV